MREPSRRPSGCERTRSVRLNRNLQVHLLHLLTVPACKHSSAEGPPSDPLRTVNSKPWTGRKRQERPFLKVASNVSPRPSAQHSFQAIERREWTLAGHPKSRPWTVAVSCFRCLD